MGEGKSITEVVFPGLPGPNQFTTYTPEFFWGFFMFEIISRPITCLTVVADHAEAVNFSIHVILNELASEESS